MCESWSVVSICGDVPAGFFSRVECLRSTRRGIAGARRRAPYEAPFVVSLRSGINDRRVARVRRGTSGRADRSTADVEGRRSEARDCGVCGGNDDSRQPALRQPAERIATFDQDGTLWVEHSMYSQVTYCLDRVLRRVRQFDRRPGSSSA